jgi:hypothetical protein
MEPCSRVNMKSKNLPPASAPMVTPGKPGGNCQNLRRRPRQRLLNEAWRQDALALQPRRRCASPGSWTSPASAVSIRRRRDDPTRQDNNAAFGVVAGRVRTCGLSTRPLTRRVWQGTGVTSAAGTSERRRRRGTRSTSERISASDARRWMIAAYEAG